jgi:predicted nucleic acid-binding protein
MSGRAFIDTNVLLYADDESAGDKRTKAMSLVSELVSASRAVLSTQVLQEFFVIATRKLGVSAEIARAKVEAFARLDVVIVTPELILAAVDLHRLHSLSFWDALVVKCAAAAGCGRVLSEDMQHGQVIEGVRIENPFRPGSEKPG